MGIYIVVFVISCFLTYLAQESFKKEKKVIGIFFSFFAILLPAGLAGLRAPIVGTDVKIYGEAYFNLACISDTFAQYRELCATDFSYALVNFIVSRFTTSVNWFFFVLELIILIPIYISAYQHRKEKSMVMFMAVTFLFFFNTSINQLRQSVAIAIIVFAIKYAEDRKLVKYLIAVAIASTFHISALLAIPIYVIFGTKDFKYKRLFEFLLLLGTVIIIANLMNLLEIGINAGILPAKYLYYLDTFAKDTVDFNVLDLLLKLSFVWLGYVVYKGAKKKEKKVESYLLLMIMDLILMQAGIFSMYIDRMALYYGVPAYIHFIPMFNKGFKDDKFNKTIIQLVCIVILATYWFIKNVYLGHSETVPYVSYILGI